MTAEHPRTRLERRDPSFILIVMIAGVALRVPSIWTVPMTDGLVQHGMVHGLYGGAFAPWDLYDLFPVDADIRAAHMELGLVPWWTAPQLDGHMVRPLTSLRCRPDCSIEREPVAGDRVGFMRIPAPHPADFVVEQVYP